MYRDLISMVGSETEEQPFALRALFGVIVLTNLMVNMDHGIFPACIDEVRKDINIGNQEVGLVGSIVYLGLVAGNLTHILARSRVLGCHTNIFALQHKIRARHLPAPQRDQLGTHRRLQLLCPLPGLTLSRWLLPGTHSLSLIDTSRFFSVSISQSGCLSSRMTRKRKPLCSL